MPRGTSKIIGNKHLAEVDKSAGNVKVKQNSGSEPSAGCDGPCRVATWREISLQKRTKFGFFGIFQADVHDFPHARCCRWAGSCAAGRVSRLLLPQHRPPALPRPGSPWTWAVKKPWVDGVGRAGRKTAASDLRGEALCFPSNWNYTVEISSTRRFPISSHGPCSTPALCPIFPDQ